MFGNKSLPSRIYSYGANPAIENQKLVEDQMFLAHRYRNAMVEAEIERRKKVDEKLLSLSPSLARIEEKLAAATEELEKLRESIKEDHKLYFTKTAKDPVKTKAIAAQKKLVKGLYTERKALRTKLFASSKWKKEQEAIEAEALAAHKELREKSDLYWGTYLLVEQSMQGSRSGAPPRFMRWDGDGHIALQIQNGMTVEEALSGADTRLAIIPGRVEVDGSRTKETGIKRKLGTALCKFRIGTDEKTHSPIFASIPFHMHRPLPEDAQIKWVHFIRRRVSTHCEWRLQFVLSQKKWVKEDQAQEGTVGIDLGWSLDQEGYLQVACFAGSDGESGRLFLPADWLGEMKRVEGIRSIRDQNFNDAKALLQAFLRTSKEKSWLKEEAKTLPQWRSPAKLAWVIQKWRKERIPGDQHIFQAMEAWRLRDKHLYEFEANLRDQLLRRRESIYRNFAADLRRSYKTARILKLALKEVHELPQAEEAPENPQLREHSRDACLSFLVRCLRESMARTVEIDPKNQARRHHGCGSLEDLGANEKLHTCSRCGEIYERHENTARNLLGMMPAGAGV